MVFHSCSRSCFSELLFTLSFIQSNAADLEDEEESLNVCRGLERRAASTYVIEESPLSPLARHIQHHISGED